MTWSGRSLRLAALVLAGGLVLTGCSGDEPEDDQPSPSAGKSSESSDRTDDGADATAEPISPPTAPAKIPAVPGDRSASGDTSITVEGDRAAFALPSGNVVCTVNETTAVCQILDHSVTPQPDHLVANGIGSCAPQDADAIMLNEQRGAWTCLDSSLVGQATVGQGGWWIKEVDGATTSIGKSKVAVLPYGSSLSVGPVTCASAESGVTCTSSAIGKQFVLSRDRYTYG